MNFGITQTTDKEFIPEPDAIGVDDIALAILGNLPNVTVTIILLDFCTAHAIGFPRKSHHAAEFVQRHLRLRTLRREDIAEIKRVLCVPIEIGSQ